MSERGAGALFIAHVNAKEGNSIEMVFMNTQKETFPERPKKEMRKSSKAKNSSVCLIPQSASHGRSRSSSAHQVPSARPCDISDMASERGYEGGHVGRLRTAVAECDVHCRS